MKFISFLSMSSNKFVQFLSCTALKNSLEGYWGKIPFNMKVKLVEYLVGSFCHDQTVLVRDAQVVAMMSVCLAKLVKLAWFEEHPDQHVIKGVLKELREMV
jgi:hypothetical protein